MFRSVNEGNGWNGIRTNCVAIVSIFVATAATRGGCVGKYISRRDCGRGERATDPKCFEGRETLRSVEHRRRANDGLHVYNHLGFQHVHFQQFFGVSSMDVLRLPSKTKNTFLFCTSLRPAFWY